MKTTTTAAALALAATALAATAGSASAQARGAAGRPAAAPATAAARPATAPQQLPQGPAIPGMCVISQERAVGASSAGRAASERLKQLAAQVQAELKPEQDSIETEAKTFQSQQAALTAEQRQQRGGALQTRATAYEQKARLRQQEMQATQQEALGRIGQELNPVLQSLYGARGCSVLLSTDGGVLASNTGFDLTDAAVTQLNARLPTITFDRKRLDAQPAGAAPR